MKSFKALVIFGTETRVRVINVKRRHSGNLYWLRIRGIAYLITRLKEGNIFVVERSLMMNEYMKVNPYFFRYCWRFYNEK